MKWKPSERASPFLIKKSRNQCFPLWDSDQVSSNSFFDTVGSSLIKFGRLVWENEFSVRSCWSLNWEERARQGFLWIVMRIPWLAGKVDIRVSVGMGISVGRESLLSLLFLNALSLNRVSLFAQERGKAEPSTREEWDRFHSNGLSLKWTCRFPCREFNGRRLQCRRCFKILFNLQFQPVIPFLSIFSSVLRHAQKKTLLRVCFLRSFAFLFQNGYHKFPPNFFPLPPEISWVFSIPFSLRKKGKWIEKVETFLSLFFSSLENDWRRLINNRYGSSLLSPSRYIHFKGRPGASFMLIYNKFRQKNPPPITSLTLTQGSLKEI